MFLRFPMIEASTTILDVLIGALFFGIHYKHYGRIMRNTTHYRDFFRIIHLLATVAFLIVFWIATAFCCVALDSSGYIGGKTIVIFILTLLLLGLGVLFLWWLPNRLKN
jgi:hypothetical protein